MADKRGNIVLRFGIVYTIICLSFLLIIYKIVVIQHIEKKNWLALAAKNTKTDIVVKANRGNIYACDSRLLASSIPTYYVYMDLRVPALHEKGGELFYKNVDSISYCLEKMFGEKSALEYKNQLTRAYQSKNGSFQLYPKTISYAKLKELRTYPLFRLSKNKSGLITKEHFTRVKCFGSLATRTIGDIYADEALGGKNGLEMQFNKQLLGVTGFSTRQKVANSYMETVQVEPIDGKDIITTIDIDLQDIAEKALIDSLKAFDAKTGYVILMEVKTGEVKAIVNMQKNTNGSYSENQNGAVSDLVEPGSTFKVASLMIALDDGKVKITDSIDTGNGTFLFGDKLMKDWNYNTAGGFHKISVADIIHVSSNVGISKIIVKGYGHNPSEFVDKLYNLKLNEPLNLEIPGAASPIIKHPGDKGTYWAKTTLPWMSIGYEVQIPPIYTLTFYNAIANNGKMIKPIFVKAISQNGKNIKEFKSTTIKESICKKTTLRDIKKALLGVIENKKGTAGNMKSKYVRIAGKTGTAQISIGKAGHMGHQVSFCGYFPADNPQYSCIVVIREPSSKLYPSGGKMAGSIFKNIAERTMALKQERKPIQVERDTLSQNPVHPITKTGNYNSLKTVMSTLKLPLTGKSADWVKTTSDEKQTIMEKIIVARNIVPNTVGMGAKDAVYVLEKTGLKVQIAGRGKVISQSIKENKKIKKGEVILLTLN
jgi:cell division protein FtsI (penicillin-binding protein 3)